MPRWTKPAQRDLQAQLEYIQREKPEIVSRIALQIKKAAETLDSFPLLGGDGMVEGTKELVLPCLPFICVYRIRDEQIGIVRLFHEHMQWQK